MTLRDWASKNTTVEMRGGEVFVSIDAVDEELDALKSLLRTNTEKISNKFLDALERVGIPVCWECRNVVLDDPRPEAGMKCAKCAYVAPETQP